MLGNDPEPAIAVKVAETVEGPKFVTVYPMVEPQLRTWPYQMPYNNTPSHDYSERDSLLDYINTKIDQMEN